MKKWIPTLALGAVALAAFAYYRRQVQLLKQFTYRIVGVSVKLLQSRLVEVQVKMRLTNDSNFEATVERVYMSVAIEGTDVGFVESKAPVDVPARSNADIDLRLVFDGQKIVKNIVGLAAILIKERKINYSLKGFVRAKSRIFRVTIPVDYAASVAIK
jgi:LEA14-like dessication related protein